MKQNEIDAEILKIQKDLNIGHKGMAAAMVSILKLMQIKKV